MAFHSSGYEAVDANDNVTERDGYTRLDLGASWRPEDDWALRVRVENLLDEKDFGSTVAGTPSNTEGNIGRVFWFGLDHTF